MSVVSNTTPLNYLILIERVEILNALYGDVVIPEAVFAELTSSKAPSLVRKWVLNRPSWLGIQNTPHVTDDELEKVQIGEREAILLAKLIQPAFIVLDDRRARRLAQERGLSVIGTLGILTAASEKGLMNLREALSDLEKTSFRVSLRLLESLSDQD